TPREARGIREARRVEERVAHVDAVVDDADLHALALAAGRGPELVGVDHRRALVRVEVVAEARVDLADRAQALERGQDAVREPEREAVEDDPVAVLDPGLRDRRPDLRGCNALRLRDPRQVLAGAGALD